LKDRVRSDFICHFTFYHGDTSGLLFNDGNSYWFSNAHNLDVAQRSPPRYAPKLDVLTASATRDPFSSSKELAKFGFLRPEARPHIDVTSAHSTPRPSSSMINFGSFPTQFDACKESAILTKKTFIGYDCV
jgi:hypothetical protein